MKRTTLAAWAAFGLITLVSVWAALLDTAADAAGQRAPALVRLSGRAGICPGGGADPGPPTRQPCGLAAAAAGRVRLCAGGRLFSAAERWPRAAAAHANPWTLAGAVVQQLELDAADLSLDVVDVAVSHRTAA